MDEISFVDVEDDDSDFYSKLLQSLVSSQTSSNETEDGSLKGSSKKHIVIKNNESYNSINKLGKEMQRRSLQDYSSKKRRKRKDSNSTESEFSSNDSNLDSDGLKNETKKKLKKRKYKKYSEISHLETDLISYTEIKEENEMESFESIHEKNKSKRKEKENIYKQESYDGNLTDTFIPPLKKKKKKIKKSPEILDSNNTINEEEIFENGIQSVQNYSLKKERKRKNSNSSNFSSNISDRDSLETPKKKKRKKKKTSTLVNDDNSSNLEADNVKNDENSKRMKHKESSEIPRLKTDLVSYVEIKEERCNSSLQNTLSESFISNNNKSKSKEKENSQQERYKENREDSSTDSFTPPVKKKKKKTEKLHKILDKTNTVNEEKIVESSGETGEYSQNKYIQRNNNEMHEEETDFIPASEVIIKTSVDCNDDFDENNSELEKFSSDNESVADFDDLMFKAEEQKQIEIELYDNMLKHLFIVVDWEIPEAHKFEKSITSCPKKELQRKIETSGVKIKKGVYSQTEDKILKSNWEKFAEIYSIPDPRVFFSFKRKGVIILPLEERIKFAQFLGKGLTNRLLFSIYQRFKVLYSEINKGRFNEYENRIILTFLRSKLSEDSSKFSKLAKVLNRDRIGLAKHCDTLLRENGITATVQWNLENMEKLLKSLLNNLGIKKTKKLKRAKISSEIWKLVSNDVNVPPKKLRYVWESKLYPRLFIKDNLDTNVVIKIVLKKLRESRVNDWKLINWETLASLFPGVTSTWLNKFVRSFLRHHVPDRNEKPLKVMIKTLLSFLNNEGQFDCKFCSNLHRPLVKLKFKNGHLYQLN